MRRYVIAFLLVVTTFAGCLTDSDDGDKSSIDSIDQLNMGGSLFVFREQGFAMSQFGTFDGTDVFDDAWIFVNGVKLNNNNGIYTKLQYLSDVEYTPGSSVKIAVYAFGDSVVKDVIVPESPLILEPAGDISSSLSDALLVNAAFPGKSA